jgi:hypothetical protein
MEDRIVGERTQILIIFLLKLPEEPGEMIAFGKKR